MIKVKPSSPKTPAIQTLIEELDRYQLSLYPEESNHLDPLDELAADGVHFVAAYENGAVLGCGAIKYLSDDGVYGEIKRVFVRIDARGKGVSKEIMAVLEAHARQKSIDLIRLETGIYQPEAIGLYARLGYHRRGPFGSYPDDPMSVFMEKRLGAAGSDEH